MKISNLPNMTKFTAVFVSMLMILSVLAALAPVAVSAGKNPTTHARGLLRLKSGGLASQVSSEDPSTSAGPLSSPPDGPPFQWSKNINVFPDPNEQDEPTVAVNPSNPDNIVVGNHERQGPAFPAAIVCAFEASFDQGVTWARFGSTPLQGPLFPAANGHSCSDSVLAADNAGNFYFAYLDLFRATSPLRVDVLVAKSTDGGQTFTTFVPVSRGLGSGAFAEDNDKEWMGVDTNPQSPFQGNIYVTYTDFATLTIKFRSSINGGTSFTPDPATSFGTVVSDVGFSTFSATYACGADTCIDLTTRYMQGSNVAVGPKGEIYVFYGDFTETETFDITAGFAFVNAVMNAATIRVSKSTNAGSTWTIGTVVNDMCSPSPCRAAGTDAHETRSTPVFRVGTIPFGSVGPNGNFVYAVWGEWNSVTFSPDAGTGRDFGVSQGNIKFARSTDAGATWQPAITVNDNTDPTKDKFFPAMVAQPDGVIHVVWMDRRLDTNGVDYDVFYATSTDNGNSFKANVRVTTASSNPRGTRFIGDYIDIGGDRGAFDIFAVWTDRRAVTTSATSAANDVFIAERLMPPP